jgi:hypothetical protein
MTLLDSIHSFERASQLALSFHRSATVGGNIGRLVQIVEIA